MPVGSVHRSTLETQEGALIATLVLTPRRSTS
jgi:hypothetical protein